MVPESELPPAPAPSASSADVALVAGKGMWIWKYLRTEGGDAEAIVRRATSAGLKQLWVRVGDSQDGFYGAKNLAALVPMAHRAHLAVIGWGFPYLYDPVGDATWSAAAIAWRGPAGEALDGFSPDIEMASEGVALTPRRVTLYLGMVRQADQNRLLVATVYRPSDRVVAAGYPFTDMAPYVDAFAPMVYWGCTEPGAAVSQTLDRLGSLRPLHLIGQGYDMAEDGGRRGPPSPEETLRFFDVARKGGALGGSLWVWQEMGDPQWGALAGYPWPPGGPGA